MPSSDPTPSSPLFALALLRWRRAASSARDGFWALSPDGAQAWFSDRLCAQIGLAPGALGGDEAALLARMHPDDLDAWHQAKQAALDSPETFSVRLRLRAEGGPWLGTEWHGGCTIGDDGASVISGTMSDVDAGQRDHKALEDLVAERTARLEQALAEAERGRIEAQHASQVQARFLAHMSHELRTPLAGLLSLADLARRVSQDATQRRYLDIAMQSGRMLQRTIDLVLDRARMQDGGVALADEPFDVAEAVSEVLRGAMPLVRERGLSMRYDWVGEPTWVRGDEIRLRQIVGNLVGNAAKFTERGHVALQATLVDDPDSAAMRRLRLDVEDTGPGLSAVDAERVFDAFVQADQSLSRPHGGTGLGLTIARDLARRMGGDITLRSELGHGSVFTLELPLPPEPDPAPVPEGQPGHAWLLYRSAPLGQWLARRLQRLGWTCELLPDCAAAAVRARSAPAARLPALVMVAEQVLSPEPDLDDLRSALPDARIGLLVRPDWHQPQLEASALALGIALDVMPLSPRDLRLITAKPAPAPVFAPVQATLDGDVLVVEDNPTNRIIAEEFLRLLGLRTRAVEDGAQALLACAERAPKLVLMDLQMPVMDGVTAARALRERQASGELPAFPIVALTAHAQASDAELCHQAGMAGFLTKPLLLETLQRELRRWLPELAEVTLRR